MLFLGTTIDGLQMGLCYAVIALGVYISFAILDFPDLTVDSSFPLGGVIATVLMLRLHMPPLLAILLSFAAGMAAGTITGTLHVRFKISKLLSGIITMTGLLSVTLALTKLLTKNGYTTTVFSYKSEKLTGIFEGTLAASFGKEAKDAVTLVILLCIVVVLKILVDLFLGTRAGLLLRAAGNNERLVISLGKDVGNSKIFGLALANGFVAMSGAIYSQLYSQYDNTSGSGKVVLALASVIIGLAVFSRIRFLKDTTAVILGAVLYSLCLNYLVLADTDGIYLKLMNAVLFALILIFNEKIKSFTLAKKKTGGDGNA